MYLYFRGLRKSIETRYIIAAQEAEKLYFYLCCYWHSSHWLNVLLLSHITTSPAGKSREGAPSTAAVHHPVGFARTAQPPGAGWGLIHLKCVTTAHCALLAAGGQQEDTGTTGSGQADLPQSAACLLRPLSARAQHTNWLKSLGILQAVPMAETIPWDLFLKLVLELHQPDLYKLIPRDVTSWLPPTDTSAVCPPFLLHHHGMTWEMPCTDPFATPLAPSAPLQGTTKRIQDFFLPFLLW